MFNKVMLIGRLGRDPELHTTQKENSICTFKLATSEGYVTHEGERVERTEWHTVCIYHPRVAPSCARCLSKGSLVYVEGALSTRKWQDKEGQDRYTTEIKAHRVLFLSPKKTQEKDEDPQGFPSFPSESSGIDDAPF